MRGGRLLLLIQRKLVLKINVNVVIKNGLFILAMEYGKIINKES